MTLQPCSGSADLNALFFGKKSEPDSNEAAASGGGATGGAAAPATDKPAKTVKKHILVVNTYQMCIFTFI